MKRVLVSDANPTEAVVGFSRAVRVGPYISQRNRAGKQCIN